MRGTPAQPAAVEASDPGASLHHVMVVGGTVAEWGALSDTAWNDRIRTLGSVAARAGAAWLTLRPFERGEGSEQARPVHPSVVEVGSCTVIVDPTHDGRERLVVTLRKLAENGQLAESAVASALLAPADAEPDLVLLLGTHDRLPTSLVWELTYAELVYLPVQWADLQEAHLSAAVEAFQTRHRRFGGID